MISMYHAIHGLPYYALPQKSYLFGNQGSFRAGGSGMPELTLESSVGAENFTPLNLRDDMSPVDHCSDMPAGLCSTSKPGFYAGAYPT